jgi:signal-transduction protein with cAMP-binding, CBS, and nucleotidyltransferase domain
MAGQPILEHIRALPMFAALSPDELATAASFFLTLQFQPGQIIFQQGQPTQGMFYFASGAGELVRIDDSGAPRVVGTVTAGRYVNEAGLRGDGIESATLRATEPSLVLFLARGRLYQMMSQYPALRGRVVFPAAQMTTAAKILFKGQRKTETVLVTYRRHWWAFARFTPIPILIGCALLLGGHLPGGFFARLEPGADWRGDHCAVSNHRLPVPGVVR